MHNPRDDREDNDADERGDKTRHMKARDKGREEPNSSALIMKEKSPNVMMLMGSVKILSTGRTVSPSIPHTIATTTAM